MAYQNTLYPYKIRIQRGDAVEDLTGHAETAGKARRHVQQMIDQRAFDSPEDAAKESIVAFEFDGKSMPVQEKE